MTGIQYFSEIKTVDPVEHVMIPKALYDEWIAAQDAALDWADQNARAFTIETAPDHGRFQIWDSDSERWETIAMFGDGGRWSKRITHWRPLPPPSNPPFPAPLEALGEVLRRIKSADNG